MNTTRAPRARTSLRSNTTRPRRIPLVHGEYHSPTANTTRPRRIPLARPAHEYHCVAIPLARGEYHSPAANTTRLRRIPLACGEYHCVAIPLALGEYHCIAIPLAHGEYHCTAIPLPLGEYHSRAPRTNITVGTILPENAAIVPEIPLLFPKNANNRNNIPQKTKKLLLLFPKRDIITLSKQETEGEAWNI